MGLFVVGYGSLDYRVRDAEKLEKTLGRFLEDLINSLYDGESPARLPSAMEATWTHTRSNTVVQVCSGANEEPLMLGGDDDETDEAGTDVLDNDFEGDESEIDLLLDGIRDPISRLFRVSTKIRNPSTRIISSKAALFQKIDEETGVDFLQVISKEDYDYVRSVFMEHQKHKACQEHEHKAPPEQSTTGDDQDEIWEPIRTVLLNERTGTDSFLIGRIAQANTYRRRQFAQWAQHRNKLHFHTKAALSAKASEGGLGNSGGLGDLPAADLAQVGELRPQVAAARWAAVPSVTTVTNLDLSRLEAMDERSTRTVSEYAPSNWQPSRDVVEFPSAPKMSGKTPFDEFFECPYCFTLCPRKMLADKAWKAHLIHDLRPYMCTYEHCNTPMQLYESRRDWVQHENSAHRKVYRCLQHSDQVFSQLDGYKRHLREEHAGLNDNEASLGRIIQASESALEVIDRPCPICMIALDTARGMEGHIALHLERLAQFSFPRSIVENDKFSNADSDKTNGTVANESRGDDFDSFIFDEVDERGDKPDSVQLSRSSSRNPNGLTEGAIQDFNKVVDTEYEISAEGFGGASKHTVVTVQVTAGKTLEYTTEISDIALSPDNEYLACTQNKATLVLNAHFQDDFSILDRHNGDCWAVAWSSDGRIATGDSHGTIKLWIAESRECFQSIHAHTDIINDLAFSPDGQGLMSTSWDETSRLWRNDGEEVICKDDEASFHAVYVAGYTPDGKHIVTGFDGSFTVSDNARGGTRWTSHGELGLITALTFTATSELLITGSWSSWRGLIALWDLESGALVRYLDRPRTKVTALSMSHSGLLMASATGDCIINLWNTKDWTVTNQVVGHTRVINTILFSNHDTQLFSCSDDRTIRIWNLHLTSKVEGPIRSDRTAQWAVDHFDQVD